MMRQIPSLAGEIHAPQGRPIDRPSDYGGPISWRRGRQAHRAGWDEAKGIPTVRVCCGDRAGVPREGADPGPDDRLSTGLLTDVTRHGVGHLDRERGNARGADRRLRAGQEQEGKQKRCGVLHVLHLTTRRRILATQFC